MSVEMKRPALTEVIRELEGLNKKGLEEACVFTLSLVHSHFSNPGYPKADRDYSCNCCSYQSPNVLLKVWM